MRLTYTCAACKRQNFLREKADTRPELQQKVGRDEIQVNCDNCGKLDKKHINRITAVVDQRVTAVGLAIGGVVSFILIYLFGLIATITLSFPIIVWRYESENAHKFNSYAIKR
ncbi:hypothetical protein [Flagellimonas myxillae]|uniref:hypothetical protein n=1 Tax=Flagellimonas myxillae TaxID=2942214 RepID=UPI00201EE9A0|nr:hypothetical protein [Muricauda myxillae]MCL6266737.1 hypothetical protein [Muricauda myxillae]